MRNTQEKVVTCSVRVSDVAVKTVGKSAHVVIANLLQLHLARPLVVSTFIDVHLTLQLGNVSAWLIAVTLTISSIVVEVSDIAVKLHCIIKLYQRILRIV